METGFRQVEKSAFTASQNPLDCHVKFLLALGTSRLCPGVACRWSQRTTPVDCQGDVATAGHQGTKGTRSKEDLEGGADG